MEMNNNSNTLSSLDEEMPAENSVDLLLNSTISQNEDNLKAETSSMKDFKVNNNSIPCIDLNQHNNELKDLNVCAYDQIIFESEVMQQVDQALQDAVEKQQKIQSEKELKFVADNIKHTKQQISHLERVLKVAEHSRGNIQKSSITKQQAQKINQLKCLEAKEKSLQDFVSNDKPGASKETEQDEGSLSTMYGESFLSSIHITETEEEKMIRTGQMTPFGTVISIPNPVILTNEHSSSSGNFTTNNSRTNNPMTGFDKFLLDQVKTKNVAKEKRPKSRKSYPHQNLNKGGKMQQYTSCQPSTSCGSQPSTSYLSQPSTSSSQMEPFTTSCKSQPSTSCKSQPSTSYLSQPSTSSSQMEPFTTSHESQPSTLSESPRVDLTQRRFSKPKKKKIKLGSKYAIGMDRLKSVNKISTNFDSDPDVSDCGEWSDDEKTKSDDDYVPDLLLSESSDEMDMDSVIQESRKRKKSTKSLKDEFVQQKLKKSPSKRPSKVIDDGLLEAYVKRMKEYRKVKLQEKHQKIMNSEDGIVDSDDEEFVEFDGDFKIPSELWSKLYSYQQTGVRWLWELHQQNCGGIVGDEMGLGKTIEVIAFLVGLRCSNITTDADVHQGLGPVILVTPTTVMHQWVKEFHKWWPLFRVAVLHESGSYVGKKDQLVRNLNAKNGILVTSYNGLVQHQKSLLNHEWHYVILDEGHKIRNPDAQATLVAKQFRTSHRLILSGSPVQNNLKELWSLFDFIFPGKLGTLPIFLQQFSVPIVQGGYANASQVQVQTAFKCASVLRDTIKPYLLRRMKADVQMNINLPNKNEQVLFCKLSEDQTGLYKAYIDSPEVRSILNARLKVFVGLINLRKICNHPDLYTGGPKVFRDTDISTLTEDMHYGYFKRSGKLIVVEALLRLWHQQSHRVLLFTQSRQMLEILEIFVRKQGYTYMRMDGSTSISSRQPAIAKFNGDPSVFIFLLTTRVGGIGVNLTGANRIIIYDPDWNPSTDAQARERSWRIGQEKQVTVYRLLTAGTIEEKIYHRQIFKQFVTNRVLKDPRQRRFFKSNDLYELFSFSETGKQGTETSAIFAGTGSEVKPIPKDKSVCGKKGFWAPAVTEKDIKSSFSSNKVEKMKELAKKLSMQLATKGPCANSSDLSEKAKSGDCRKPVTKESSDYLVNGTVPSKKPKCESSALIKKTKKKKKKDRPTVDGEQIDYLVKKAIYKTSVEQEKDSYKDDYVLSKLFKQSGVHSALKHDVIVDASDPDYMLVEGEANKVAQDAVKNLKLSRRLCSRAAEGIPTWTGTNGTMRNRFGMKTKGPNATSVSQSLSTPVNNSPENKASTSGFTPKKSAMHTDNIQNDQDPPVKYFQASSSSDLLSAIRERTNRFGVVSDSDSTDSETEMTVPSGSATQYDELLVDIRNFIAFRASTDGCASTEELLQEFKDKLPKDHTAIFKSLLQRICDFSRTSSGDGIWYLKEEFR